MGSRAESSVLGRERSDSAARMSSWLDVCSSWEDPVLATKEVFSMIRSRISLPSVGVLWEKDPPAAMSWWADSVSSPM